MTNLNVVLQWKHANDTTPSLVIALDRERTAGDDIKLHRYLKKWVDARRITWVAEYGEPVDAPTVAYDFSWHEYLSMWEALGECSEYRPSDGDRYTFPTGIIFALTTADARLSEL